MDEPPSHKPSGGEPPSLIPGLDGHDEPQQQAQRAPLASRPNAAARHSKRLTLNFPISSNSLPSEQGSPRVMSPLAQSSTFPSPSRSSATTPALNEPADEGYMFLTALAAQERKVLELREELHKAEAELANLKRQWAMGEKGRRKTEIVHHAEVMKPLKPPPAESIVNGIDVERSTPSDLTKLALQTRMSRELERKGSHRKSGSNLPSGGGSFPSGRPRTVFQSSRHARTLSLLSPNGLEPFSPTQSADASKSLEIIRGSSHPRSATLPSIDRTEGNSSENVVSTARVNMDQRTLWRRSLPIAQDGTAETLMRTGKQMASDLKDGLWTFLEDIRQATVGDEGINATESRSIQGAHRPSRPPKRAGMHPSTSREQSIASSTATRSVTSNKPTSKTSTSTRDDISFWSEFGIESPEKPKTTSIKSKSKGRKQKAEESSLLDVDDNWDVWDTPQPKTHTPSSSSSTFPSSRRDPSPSTRASSPRTSASFADLKAVEDANRADGNQSENIPWPALTKLHPSNLTRTASSLMAEWERSLSPSPSPSHDNECKDLKSD
ncbi:predicted protein [Uncinocarpus reesii 1704]|uniref:DUF4048 domain-containing protein n=1 Tax=Uncinocarpus reesii (strain UAMH 1704) TaxID=336963 RepID=C4JMC7_UNCRE|nr:uncharacterized protein UREG_03985 [Uncinocarpus reesii 1704]EEP79139.1 predicted protein [Uncinocarpus reesii 1704]